MNDYDSNGLRLPPQAIEAEQSLLGSMMQNPNVLDDVLDVIVQGDFYRADHRAVFSSIEKLFGDGSPVDALTVAEHLAKSGNDKITLVDLGAMVKNTPNTGNVRAYTKIVKDRSMLRALIENANEIIQKAHLTEGREAVDIVAESANLISAIEQDSTVNEARLLADLMSKFVNDLEERFSAESSILGYSTGFPALDNRWSGLEGGKVYVVAGRPKMGKSLFMLNVAINVAKEDVFSHIFSLEMPESQCVNKIISNLGRCEYRYIRNPKLILKESGKWERITAGTAAAKKLKIIIDDQPRLSVNQIRARVRASIKKYGKGAVFIDYLQLMRVDEKKNLVDAIGDVTSRLKEIAKSFDVPIVLLSQLNREVDKRPNKRPVPSDLRSSGSIEQDADAVAFVYRDEVYDPQTDQLGIAEIITSAIRDGEPGVDKLIFNGDMQSFESLPAGWQQFAPKAVNA